MEERRTMMSSDSVLGLVVPVWTVNFTVLDWRWTQTDLLLSHVVLINTVCSVSTFTMVNLPG